MARKIALNNARVMFLNWVAKDEGYSIKWVTLIRCLFYSTCTSTCTLRTMWSKYPMCYSTISDSLEFPRHINWGQMNFIQVQLALAHLCRQLE